MQVGDIVKAFGEEFEVIEFKPRNDWANEGRFEPKGVELLGIGIIGLNLITQKKEYFYNFDID